MVRNSIAAVVACLYVAGSVWLVRSEGQSYRDGLSRMKVATEATSKADADHPGEVETASVPVPVPNRRVPSANRDSRPSSRRDLPEEATPPRRIAPLVKSSESDSSPAPASAGVAEAKTPIPRPADRATAPATAKAAETADRPPELGSFWGRPELKMSWNLTPFSIDDERRLGAELHNLILQFNRRSEDDSLQLRVDMAAEPLLKKCFRKNVKYTFTVLDSDAVNTFSHPGGYVYVTRGLLELIGKDEDYALEFAIGHEMAHVDLEHALKCLRDPGVTSMKEGTLQKLYMLILPFGYLVDQEVNQEFEADDWIYHRMKQLGRTDRECLILLKKLDGYAKKNGFGSGQIRPKLGRDTSPVENHIRAKVAAYKRLKHLKELIANSSQPPK